MIAHTESLTLIGAHAVPADEHAAALRPERGDRCDTSRRRGRHPVIELTSRRGDVLRVESDEQAKAWEVVGYFRPQPKKAPAKKPASSKSN